MEPGKRISRRRRTGDSRTPLSPQAHPKFPFSFESHSLLETQSISSLLSNYILYFQQGTILGAFYYGYTVMQIPGGWLGQRFGGTRVFGICLGIASVLTMLTPIAARTSVAALITLRVIEGLALVSSLK